MSSHEARRCEQCVNLILQAGFGFISRIILTAAAGSAEYTESVFNTGADVNTHGFCNRTTVESRDPLLEAGAGVMSFHVVGINYVQCTDPFLKEPILPARK